MIDKRHDMIAGFIAAAYYHAKAIDTIIRICYNERWGCDMDSSNVAVIGGGAWGTAMACALARGGHRVTMWVLEKDVCDAINRCHENTRYLPSYALNERLIATNDIETAVEGKEAVIVASPSLFLASTVKRITAVPNIADGSSVIAALTKGFVPSKDGTPQLVLETMENVLPGIYKGCTVYVSGPSHAEEVAMGKVTGLVCACENPRNSIKVRELLRVPGILPYSSFDVVGVQVCAAAKNIIAVVYGAMDALAESSSQFGDNAESLLMAAGLAEIQALGFAMGATHAETFVSIAGVGDLDVTCKSRYGRNRRFGQDLIKNDIMAQFNGLDDLIANMGKLGYLSEGAVACKYVHTLSEKKHLRLTICNGLYRVLNKEVKPLELIDEILSEQSAAEHINTHKA